MDLVDIKGISVGLFITGALFILAIGSFLSLGVLRLFQEKKRQGLLLLGLSVISFVGLVLTMNTWFV